METSLYFELQSPDNMIDKNTNHKIVESTKKQFSEPEARKIFSLVLCIF